MKVPVSEAQITGDGKAKRVLPPGGSFDVGAGILRFEAYSGRLRLTEC